MTLTDVWTTWVIFLTQKMTSTQVVKGSASVSQNSPSQDYTRLDDHTSLANDSWVYSQAGSRMTSIHKTEVNIQIPLWNLEWIPFLNRPLLNGMLKIFLKVAAEIAS